MKILLLGEFSGLHKNLKEGLVELGHEVTIASSGDGWKKIENDINWGSTKNGLAGKADSLYKLLKSVPKFTGYDVVQLISPVVFPKKFGINDYILDKLFEENGKVFLIAAGATNQATQIADFCEQKFKYPELFREIKKGRSEIWSQTKEGRVYNSKLLDKIDGVIPVMYEYAQGFRDINYNRLCDTIPLPINTDKISYQENVVQDKVIFFHGINREGVKGTPLIVNAMEKLKKKYPTDVEIFIEGKLPLEKYLSLLRRVNVSIDQAYSVSYGMNALYNMAMGKIVVGGGEEECLKEFNMKNSPLHPIEPDEKNILNILTNILEERHLIKEEGYNSRKFVESLHNYKKISNLYLKIWSLNK